MCRPKTNVNERIYIYILQADKSLCLLTMLKKNAVGSAADRITKSNFRGRCGTVNYHTVINLYV